MARKVRDGMIDSLAKLGKEVASGWVRAPKSLAKNIFRLRLRAATICPVLEWLREPGAEGAVLHFTAHPPKVDCEHYANTSLLFPRSFIFRFWLGFGLRIFCFVFILFAFGFFQVAHAASPPSSPLSSYMIDWRTEKIEEMVRRGDMRDPALPPPPVNGVPFKEKAKDKKARLAQEAERATQRSRSFLAKSKVVVKRLPLTNRTDTPLSFKMYCEPAQR